MRPVNFEGATHTFTKPRDWDRERDGDCFDLPVMVVRLPETRECVSMWKPTADELKRLHAGGFIRLGIVGGQPPVMLSVETVKELPPMSAEREGQ